MTFFNISIGLLHFPVSFPFTFLVSIHRQASPLPFFFPFYYPSCDEKWNFANCTKTELFLLKNLFSSYVLIVKLQSTVYFAVHYVLACQRKSFFSYLLLLGCLMLVKFLAVWWKILACWVMPPLGEGFIDYSALNIS